MVTTTLSYADSRYRASTGEGYDGVVRVSINGFYGTGALLYDGMAILTAAHLFEGTSGTAELSFETVGGMRTLQASRFLVHPDYDPVDGNNDLALVWLQSSAPTTANRYQLVRTGDEIGKSFTMVGYGLVGTGASGSSESNTSNPLRLKAQNRFDADAHKLKTFLGSQMDWDPTSGTQLVADFDDGSYAHDALGRLIVKPGTGLGSNEGLIAPGDSGGPAFISGQIAGVASYTASLSRGDINPDIDELINSSFGEIAAWQRMSFYQQWIDQSLRAALPNAPSRPQDVVTAVPEGHSGTSYAYFLLQFTGVRSDPSQVLSVSYATRDGTAQAGSDYIAASGRLNLYPGENQAAIPVEIIGDRIDESDEDFYLDVFDPIGGSFGTGVVKLTAVRTIVDDDPALS